MERYFALIKNNLVDHVVVGDDMFLSHIQSQYDAVVDVTNINRPTTGDSYYPDTQTFVSNTVTLNNIPVDMSASYLQQGTEEGFTSFQISKYNVSYSNGIVTIGCKQYSAPGLLDALYKVLQEKQSTVSIFTTLDDGPTHGKFGITWSDAQKLYDALIKVKF